MSSARLNPQEKHLIAMLSSGGASLSDIKKYAKENNLYKAKSGLFCNDHFTLFDRNDFIDQLLWKVRDDIYCSNMLGGDSGQRRLSKAISDFEQAVKLCVELGLNKKLSHELIDKAGQVRSDVFLIAVKVTGNFDAFSRFIDDAEKSNEAFNAKLQEEGIDEQQGENARELMEFLNMVMTANPNTSASATQIADYKAIRAEMLAASDGSTPSREIMESVINRHNSPAATADGGCRIM